MLNMEKLWNVVHGLRPVLLMIMIQVIGAVMVTLYKLAAEDGMPMKVLTCYRYVVALATIVPMAFFLERKRLPKLTWTVVLQAFTIGLFGSSLAQNLFAESLILTSPTFATAMSNLVPAFTFIMAIFLRIEKLGLNTMVGKAKVLGTLTSVSGAMVLTIYKGVEIKVLSTSIDLLHKNEQHGSVSTTHHHQQINHRPYLGSLLALASCFSAAFSLILTSKLSVRFPCHYSCAALICIFGTLQTFSVAVFFERDWNQWKLGWNVRLLTALFAGLASGLAGPISMWCVRLRGPVFVSMFTPLLLVLVAIASTLFLKEQLYLGSILGAVLIISGLYIVMWGKSKEMKRLNQTIPSKSIEASNITSVAKVDETKSIIPINPLAVCPNIIPPMILPRDDGGENKEIFSEIESVGKGSEEGK